ncbi:MAG: efflux RND transporter periplasmic adaptor subunit [Bacteroidia bacterium]
MKKSFFIGLIALLSCGDPAKNTSQGPTFSGLQAEVWVAHEEKLSEAIHTTGTVLPNEQVELKAEESGRLIHIHFQEGSSVQMGSPLFQIDDREFQAQARNIRVQLELAKKELKRNETLFQAQALSEEAYDASANKVASLQAELDLLNVRIDRCLIRAPFSGRIGLRLVSAGSYLTVGQPLVQLVQEKPLKIEFEVPELYAPYIRKGMPVTGTYSGSTDSLHAVIYAFESQIDPGSRNLKIRALSPMAKENLVPGVFLNINLKLNESSTAILIPTQAVIPELNGQKVFKVVNGQVKSQAVQTGVRRANDIEIREGVQAGDSILITGILQARDGMPVQVNQGKGTE